MRLRLRISVVGYKGQKTNSVIPNSFYCPSPHEVWTVTVIQKPSPPVQVCQEASAG